MSTQIHLGDIIGDLYGVLDGSSGWGEAVAHLADWCGSAACALMRHDFSTGFSQLMAAAGLDEVLRQRVGGAIVSRNPLLAREAAFRLPGSVWLDSDLMPKHELLDTLFCRAWMMPQKLSSWACFVVRRREAELIYLEFFGGNGQGLLDARRIGRLRPLVTHIHRVLEILARLDEPRTEPAQEPVPARVVPLFAQEPGPGPHHAPVSCLPPQARLRALYGLTRAEVRVALLLACGLSLSATAERLFVSHHTAKTHLHRIYAKTGTSRQAELLALLLTGPAGLSGTGSAALAAAAGRERPSAARIRWDETGAAAAGR